MKVKNKNNAPIQITAEQILRESWEIQGPEACVPKQKINDRLELADYRLRQRKKYEDLIRRSGCWSVSIWVKYAQWEESQRDFSRARSVWERALEVDYKNTTLWLKYADMEMKNKFINHARNIWDRAVSLLPRVDQLWYKYIHMEEMLGHVAGARQIFERWMAWEPDHHGWSAYLKFELRYNEFDRARHIYERYVQCLPTVKAWVKFAKFELGNGDVGRARKCYERAVAQLEQNGEIFVAFAEFEEQCKELERARCIYSYALEQISKEKAEGLYDSFLAFERRHGGAKVIENVMLEKRRSQYEVEVNKDMRNYDIWFDYIRLEESVGNKEAIRALYKRATVNIPPVEEKQYWQRYIYLWIFYALYEELEVGDMERAREVYSQCLKLIPHTKFSFSKIWIMAAQFEIRQKNLQGARQVLGNAIGMAPKEKIFKTYIEIESSLVNVERCRTLYERYLEWGPGSCYAWINYAELEKFLGETDRARSIFELATMQPVLDMPERLWKAYIDFEISKGEHGRARQLYERLLDKTMHPKVWVSYAEFEASIALASDEAPEHRAIRARGIFQRAIKQSAPEQKQERAMLFHEWEKMESTFGEFGDMALVQQKMPLKVKRKRPITSGARGTSVGFEEEYVDYLFPGELQTMKILEVAYHWKRQKVMGC